MAIPNTTPTPNKLYNGEMKKMKDTELRVVLLVTRATLGWIADKKTGMRKQEDWIAHSQLIKKSGRTSRSIYSAVKTCSEKGWIETRDKDGNILKTPEERMNLGGRVYYRLGKVFLDKIRPLQKDTGLPLQKKTPTPAKNSTPPLQKGTIYKRNSYKRNITKEGLEKPTPSTSIKRNSKKFPKAWMNQVCEAYQTHRGIKLQGKEWLPIQQAIKTMFLSGRSVKDIIGCMAWLSECSEDWMENWTIRTVKIKLPFYIAKVNKTLKTKLQYKKYG